MLVVLGTCCAKETWPRSWLSSPMTKRWVVANDAAAAHSVSPPTRHDVAHVRDALRAHGLANLDERDD